MSPLKSRTIILAAICLAAAALNGCSLKRSPEDTTRQFMDALKRADEPAVRALMTRMARERMDKPLNMSRNETMRYTLGEPVVREDFAQVPVDVHEGTNEHRVTVKMKQDEGEWRIYALGFATEPGVPEITFDMEHPEAIYGDLFRGLGEGMGAMFKGLGEGMGAMLKGLGECLQHVHETPHDR